MTLTPNYCTLHSPSSMALERPSHIKNIYPCSPTSLWDMTLFYDIAISKDLNLGEKKNLKFPLLTTSIQCVAPCCRRRAKTLSTKTIIRQAFV